MVVNTYIFGLDFARVVHALYIYIEEEKQVNQSL